MRGVRLLVLPTVVVLGVAVFASGRLGPAVRIYALIVCAVVLALAVGSLREAFPQTPRHRSRRMGRSRRADPPRSLAQLENELTMSIGDALDFHYRLRPHLRSAAERFAAPDSQPGALTYSTQFEAVCKKSIKRCEIEFVVWRPFIRTAVRARGKHGLKCHDQATRQRQPRLA